MNIKFTMNPAEPIERVMRPTGKLRWATREVILGKLGKILQQEWVEEDKMYVDWMGPRPVYSWQDVPMEEDAIKEKAPDSIATEGFKF